MPSLSGVSALAVSLPKGGGDVRGLGGSFVADYNRGTGSFGLDLRLPAGAAGIRPALALGYNSGGANGAFGLGWSLGVPSIHRDGERRFVQFDETDSFLLDQHGELLRLADGSYRPRYDELFARIERGAHWEVRPKEGGVQRYGLDDEGRIAHPDHPDRVLAWALQEVEDRNGNRIRYRYLADGNNRYLREVAYGIYRLVLTYEPRPDVFGTARHGFPITTALRCAAIEIHCDRVAGLGLIRKYSLSYVEPAETPISLLRQIRLSGHRLGADAVEVVEMPPLTFGYTAFRPPAGRCRPLANPLGFPLAPLGMSGTDLLDCTGDGLPDLVQIDSEQHRYWANRGDGTFDAPRRIRSFPSGVRLAAPGISFGDLDGDGAVDLLVAEGLQPGYFPKLAPAEWGPFQRYRRAPSYSLRDPNNRLVDLDADGKVDLLRTTPTALVIHLNRGQDGWQTLPPILRIHDREVFPDVSLADPRVHLADMTGDGLADIVVVQSGEVAYWPYEGLGRWGRQRVVVHSPVFARPERPRSIFLTDVNGDGIADLVAIEADTVTVWINQFGVRFADPIRLRNTPLTGGAELRVADMLGSGTAGVLWSYREDLRPHTRYLYLELGGEEKPYLLSSIDNGLGKRTSIHHRSSSHFAARDRVDGHPWETFLPFPVQVVAEIRQDDASAGLATRLEIRYHDGLYDGRERRFAGFGRVDLLEHGDATAPSLLTAIRFDTTPTAGLSRDDRALAVARWGKMLETSQQSLDGPLLRRSTSVWTTAIADRVADGTPVVAVHRTATRSEATGIADGPVVLEHAYEFDDSGNIIRDRTTANGPTPLELIGEVEYARRPDGALTALPSRVVERRADGTLIRELRSYYDGPPFDGLPLGQATAGNPVRQSVRVLEEADFAAHYGAEGLAAAALGYRVEGGAIWTDSARYRYNAHGNLVGSRDPFGHETTLDRDAEGIFPIRLENAAGQITRFRWDDAALQPDEVTDANGAISRFTFDALGRVSRLALAGDTLDDPSERVAYHLAAIPPHLDLEQKITAGAPPARRRIFYDGSGQERQARAVVDDATVMLSAFEALNARGWIGRRGDPSFAASLEYGPAPEGATTTLHYDAIGRVIAADLPGGRSTRVVYDSFRTVFYDANDTDGSPDNVVRGFFDTPTIHRLDGWGRLVGITELHDGLITNHAYRYDESGRLLEATGPDGGRIFLLRFDLAGNRLVIDHRDAGRRLFYYDAAGQLVRAVDAAGRRIETAYDALRRPVETSVDGQPIQTFDYDETDRPNRVGRLSAVHDEAGDWDFEYDARGRPTRRTLTASGQSWTLEHRYHVNGQIAGIRYPDGEELAYHYNRAGQLVAVPGALDEIQYDPRGRRTLLRAANGVQTLVDYDPLTRFLARLRVLGSAGVVLHDVTYQRDAIGNVLGQLDSRPPGPNAPHSRRFTLDARYRLIEAAGGGAGAVAPYARSYAYDAAGNLRTYPTHGLAPILYDPPGSNRIAGVIVNGAPIPLYGHDSNGNLVRLPERELQFDALGRLVRVQRSDGAEVQYRYNASGERIWRTARSGGTTRRTLFLAGIYEEDDDGAIRRYLAAGGTPIALDESGGRTYLHGNELGHVMVLTDSAGALAGSRFFHPFGEAGSAVGQTVPAAFGGKILDEVSGLYHFGARYYAPEVGRFVSPDPLYLTSPWLALSNPQLLNLYAYAANNPMVYADPSGLSLLGSILGGLIGGFVGALVFVVSAGNPFLAGLAGGLVGGAVAGGIDGGAKGAVLGGLLGGLGGAFGGLVVWGISALGGTLAGRAVAEGINLMLATLGAVATIGTGAYQGVENGNWDLLAGAAASFAGSCLGTILANRIMMSGFWKSDDPKQVRDAHRMFSERARSRVDISDTTYVLDHGRAEKKGEPAHEAHGVITFFEAADYERIKKDYLEYLHIHAHELGHAMQEKTVANFDAAWLNAVDYFQTDADDKGFWLMRYSPFPYQTYALVLAPSILSLSLPTVYENRKKGGDFWGDLDRAER